MIASTYDRIVARSQIKRLQGSSQLIGLVIVHGVCDRYMDHVIAIGLGLALRAVIDNLTDSEYRLTSASSSCYK